MVGKWVSMLWVWGNISLLCAWSGFGVVCWWKRCEVGSRQKTKAVSSPAVKQYATAFADFDTRLTSQTLFKFPTISSHEKGQSNQVAKK